MTSDIQGVHVDRWSPAARSSADTASAEDLVRTAYREHGGELYRFARRWTRDETTAEDLVQDVVVRAWRGAHRYDPERGSLRTWLFAIARNAAIDQGRADALRPATGQPPREDQLPIADHVDQVLAADAVVRGLATIGPDQRVAIVETYLRDRPYDDVAAELGVSASTLRSRVFHGLRALRERMQQPSTGREGKP